MNARSRETERLYISHGAGGGANAGVNGVDWFIVEPRHDAGALAGQVESLRRGGRTVIEVVVRPWDTLTRPMVDERELLGESNVIVDYSDDVFFESVGVSPETARYLLDHGIAYAQVVVQLRPKPGVDTDAAHSTVLELEGF